jgi:tetrahydromethanopterin S-methyltransferase subunit B
VELQMSAEREVIEHGVEIKHIQSDVDSIMEDMEQLKARLDSIEKTLEEIKGGWKVFIALATIISGVISWMVTHWLGK